MFVPKIQNKSNAFVNGPFRDILPYLFQYAIAAVLLIVYLTMMFLLPVPGCPTGYLGPGGIGSFGEHPNCTGGAAAYVDRQIFGERQLYQTPTSQFPYLTGPYDPEGTLGCLTSIVLCFIGLQSGRILVCYKEHKSRIIRWVIWGIIWGSIALFLCEGRKNTGFIPLNKNLWSPSFIFVMAGTGFCLLALCYFLIDVQGWWNGSPFQYVGMNSIMIYCCHELLGGRFPFGYYAPNEHGPQLAANLIAVTAWFIVAYRMFQLDFFVNI